MPFPFLAHQAPVLPLKLRWPRLSGTGLVLGSMAPDFGYFLLGASVTRDWHRPHGIFLYCLPVAVVAYLLVTRLFAAPIARHLPRLGSLRLRDLAYLEAQPRTIAHLAMVAACIVVGAATHLAWDLFTHHGTWMGDHVPWLRQEVFSVAGRSIDGTRVLWTASTAIGGAVSLLVLREMGRHDLWRRWAEGRLAGSTRGIEPDAPPATSSLAFWGPVAGVTLTAAVVTYATRPLGFDPGHWSTWGTLVFLRAASLGFVALATVAWRERRTWRHRSSGQGDAARRAIDPAA